MRAKVASIIFRLAVSVALAVSAALLVDYLRPLPAFCDMQGGCETVRATALGQAGPLMPGLGLAGFGSLMLLSLWPSRRNARLLVTFAVLGGLAGAALLFAQAFVIGAFCQLCVVVDVSAIVAALAAVALRRGEVTFESPRLSTERWLWGSASVLSTAIPILIGVVQPSPPVPRAVAELWKPGKINVVELSDFQCPYCRRLHPKMNTLLSEYGDKVHFVRLNMPLKSHPQARDAARAFVCAGRQGKGEAMADALFESRDLTPQNCEKLAEGLGLAMDAYRACIADPTTEARIEADIDRIRGMGFNGLPTVWIGSERLRGLQTEDKIRDAFARAAAELEGSSNHSTSYFWGALAAGVVGVGIVALRMGRAS